MILRHLLQRFSGNFRDTLGLLLLDNEFIGYTLEDEARKVKVPGETRIPAGLYPLALRKELTPLTVGYRAKYPWFTWHIEILGVPNFTNVYLHIGNSEQDTDACVLLGDSANNNRVMAGYIGNSTACYERWYKRVQPVLEAGGEATILIKDEVALGGQSLPIINP